MKVLISIAVILLTLGLFYFFTANQNNLKNYNQETTIEKLQSEQSEENNETPQLKNDAETIKTEEEDIIEQEEKSVNNDENVTENNPLSNQDISEGSIDENSSSNDSEYSEEVSSEDFKEFIDVALEELDAGQEMAEAIITEMEKIAKAQPDHLEHVKNFYRTCISKSTLSEENQNLCRQALENFEN